jgi:hypothetical protein
MACVAATTAAIEPLGGGGEQTLLAADQVRGFDKPSPNGD